MKMMYGNVPVKSMNVHSYELSTQDCTATPSDLHSGITCVSKGKKITGTGRVFEFASYGEIATNTNKYIPSSINVVEIASTEYPIKSLYKLSEVVDIDFTTETTIGVAIVNNIEYPISVIASNNILTFNCDETIQLEFFCGKDNYL